MSELNCDQTHHQPIYKKTDETSNYSGENVIRNAQGVTQKSTGDTKNTRPDGLEMRGQLIKKKKKRLIKQKEEHTRDWQVDTTATGFKNKVVGR